MSQARTNRRYAKRMRQDNNHLSGMGVPKYAKQGTGASKAARLARAKAKAVRLGRTFGFKG